MKLFTRKPKELTAEQKEEIYTKDFFDMILPATISFKANYIIVGEEQAILANLADKNGVTLRRPYSRQ